MIKNYRQPIMYISKLSKVSGNMDDLFYRLNIYGNEVANQTQGRIEQLIVVTHEEPKGWNAKQKARLPFLKICLIKPGFQGFIGFRRNLQRISENSSSSTTLIAGDPWWAFLFLAMIKFSTRSDSFLQIQLHGDIYSRPKKINLIEYLKFFYIRIALFFSDSIRVVSDHQKIELLTISKTLEKKINVSPIPLKIPDEIKEVEKSKVIGIVGRLHNERGIHESVKILASILQSFPEYCGLIIGEGPEWFSVKNEIRKFSLSDRIEMTGFLKHSEVLDKLSKIEILISSAPKEGYGLTIREAYLLGVSVLALRNQGTIQANSDWNGSFTLFDSFDEAIVRISRLIEKNDSNPINDNRKKIMEIQQRIDCDSIRTLIASWI